MATARGMWEDLGSGSRAGLVAGVLAIALLTALAAYWVLRDEKGVLASDLDPRDAASVLAELESMKVDYELALGGTRILVPSSQVQEVRLKLMGSGLPLGGGVGLEIFDDSDFGVTEFAQRINFQRAMQGELSRTITALREVKRARVHLVMPQQSLFADRRQSASAAVNVALARGKTLSEAQVLGIQRLVAASVETLEAERVTVVDEDGVTLSRASLESDNVEVVSARLAKKREVEVYLRDKVEAVLSRRPGGEAAVVSVDVSLDMDQVKTARHEVVTQEDGSGWVRRRRETRSWTGPEVDASAGEGGVTTETEYDLGRRVEEIVSMPGGVQRLSVGVLLPGRLAEEEVSKIREVVAMAVGLTPQRGDSIAVHAVDWGSGTSEQRQAQPGTPAPPAAAAGLPEARSAPAQPGRVPWWPGRLPVGRARSAAVLAASVLSAAALGALARRTRKPRGGLSSYERKRVLDQLRGWLRAEVPAPDERRST